MFPHAHGALVMLQQIHVEHEGPRVLEVLYQHAAA